MAGKGPGVGLSVWVGGACATHLNTPAQKPTHPSLLFTEKMDMALWGNIHFTCTIAAGQQQQQSHPNKDPLGGLMAFIINILRTQT